MRKRLVDCDAVIWLKRAVLTAAAAIVFAIGSLAPAQAETRTLKLYNTHTKERVSITFKKNGRYIPSGLREANRFLRDWRRNEMTKIDPELLDLVWEVYQKVRANKHIYVVSSYRSPATNNMLRKRSKGVARNSQHTLGKAMDFYIPGVNLAKLRAAGLRKHVGGVGYYPRSGSPFVHMDTGRVRHWPRMSRSQLAKVFPNGKTLHVPTDGKPLKGYKLALAEAKSGKSRSSRPTIVASSNKSKPRTSTRNQRVSTTDASSRSAENGKQRSTGGNLFASLFGRANDSNADKPSAPGAIAARREIAQATVPSPIVENPPVPGRKILETPADTASTLLASASPEFKPAIDAPVQLASAAPLPAPNTLDAQRAAISSGQPGAASQPLDSRFQITQAPGQKPDNGLTIAALAAANNLGGETAPVPLSAPATDPVAAIAAATGTSVPSPSPAPRSGTALAYASATATPPSLNRSLRPTASPTAHDPAALAVSSANKQRATQPSVSGRIPRDQIVDPLAGFASLPDKSAPVLLSGVGTTRHQTFAWLSHPNQRQLKNVMKPGNRFVSANFEKRPYGNLRTDRFDGPAIVVLPVRFAR